MLANGHRVDATSGTCCLALSIPCRLRELPTSARPLATCQRWCWSSEPSSSSCSRPLAFISIGCQEWVCELDGDWEFMLLPTAKFIFALLHVPQLLAQNLIPPVLGANGYKIASTRWRSTLTWMKIPFGAQLRAERGGVAHSPGADSMHRSALIRAKVSPQFLIGWRWCSAKKKTVHNPMSEGRILRNVYLQYPPRVARARDERGGPLGAGWRNYGPWRPLRFVVEKGLRFGSPKIIGPPARL